MFPFVIPGLTRNPGGEGINVDLDSGSEAGVTDKKTGCAVAGKEKGQSDRKELIRRSLDIFSSEKMRDDFMCGRLLCR